MKLFLNTVILGAGLTAGIISLCQNVPFIVFVKRVGLTILAFYLIGVVLNIAWNAASVSFGYSSGKSSGTGSEQKKEAAENVG
jgi:hypothetical protein